MPPSLKLSPRERSNISELTLSLLERTIQGRNPHIDFTFREIRCPRGTIAHPPHTDLLEIRPSITVEFIGASNGVRIAHLFSDGTYKDKAKMDEEVQQRRLQASQMKVEEDKFPKLNQTTARLDAWRRMESRIRVLRDDARMSMMAKYTERENAFQEYRTFVEDQARARKAAAEAAEAARKKAGR